MQITASVDFKLVGRLTLNLLLFLVEALNAVFVFLPALVQKSSHHQSKNAIMEIMERAKNHILINN